MSRRVLPGDVEAGEQDHFRRSSNSLLKQVCDGSVGVRFARPYHTDLMIGEFEVRAGKFNLRHMTGDAVRSGSRTRGSLFNGRGCPSGGAVACRASGIVVGGSGDQLRMRFVAGGTADASV